MIAALLLSLTLVSGLTEIRNERNSDRRAKLALENADQALTTARDAYKKEEMWVTEASLKELEESVELARTSLEETGRDPRRRPKWFKYGEAHTHELIRRLNSLENAMDLDDRHLLEGAKTKLHQTNEEWLLGIVQGKKKESK